MQNFIFLCTIACHIMFKNENDIFEDACFQIYFPDMEQMNTYSLNPCVHLNKN